MFAAFLNLCAIGWRSDVYNIHSENDDALNIVWGDSISSSRAILYAICDSFFETFLNDEIK